MPNINFNCPSCEKKDKITLMGESHGVFEKKCKECGITIELTVEDNELKEARIKEKYLPKIKTKVPEDYQKYDFKEEEGKKKEKHFWVKTISFLILTNSGCLIPKILYQYPATPSNNTPNSFVVISKPFPSNTVNVFSLFPNCGAIFDCLVDSDNISNFHYFLSYMNNSYYSSFLLF